MAIHIANSKLRSFVNNTNPKLKIYIERRMKKIIIVSNRLPVSITHSNNEITVVPSSGGLATGLKSYHSQKDSIWVGWPGIITDEETVKQKVIKKLETEHCVPVFLTEQLVEQYYDGYSNTTIWPLFHYFTEYAKFNDLFWSSYVKVNQMFADIIVQKIEPNDTIWIHDYQLLLLPKILKEKYPDLQIGFFLHIPFPSYEVFRILPQRDEILEGILGADLIGFHTYDYARHFKSSVQRLKGYDVEFNKIQIENKSVFVDVFPMGIDYKLFNSKAYEIVTKPIQERSPEQKELDRYLLEVEGRKLILSIDRLDYTKGILHRLQAFELFLDKHPEYHQKATLVMVIVPSRVDVEQYQYLRNDIEMKVGGINGKYGTMQWRPVIYFYRSVSFNHLIELYTSSDVALLTPLRDGMNLVAKEYISTQINKKGVLILSEMAGASKELGEAICVNPFNIQDVSNAIYNALNFTESNTKELNEAMQLRLKRYDVFAWANDFITNLLKIKQKQQEFQTRKINSNLLDSIHIAFTNATNKIFFLDYDGTLQRFFNNPLDAKPDTEIYELLDSIKSQKNTEVVIVSGRDKNTMNEWFGKKSYTLIAEHGAWLKETNGNWINKNEENPEWKKHIKVLLDSYVDRTPGSFIEDKTHSLVWHYRKSDIEMGILRALELKEDISSFIVNHNLEVLEGKKVIEIKTIGINKGAAAVSLLFQKEYDFIVAIGDDWTDENLFKLLPADTITIKVGQEKSMARYFVDSYKDVHTVLHKIIRKI